MNPQQGPSEPLVDVVLPCLNEAMALPSVLAAMPAGFRAIVVDNGSTDGSGAIAADYALCDPGIITRFWCRSSGWLGGCNCRIGGFLRL